MKYIKTYEQINNTIYLKDLTLGYFTTRIPFLKTFELLSEPNSNSSMFRAVGNKSWDDIDISIKEDGVVHVKNIKIKTNFFYNSVSMRDFDKELDGKDFKPLIKNDLQFNISTHLKIDTDGLDEKDSMFLLLIKNMISEELKYTNNIVLDSTGIVDTNKLDIIINDVNGKFFKMEEVLNNMGIEFTI